MPVGLIIILASAILAPQQDVDVCLETHLQAQHARDEARLIEARDLFRRCAEPKCPTLVRKDCVSLLSETQRLVPSVVVNIIRDDTSTPVDGFWIDDIAYPPPHRAIELDPGPHRFRARQLVRDEPNEMVVDFVVQPSIRRQIVRLDLTTNTRFPRRRESNRVIKSAGFATLGIGIALGASATATGVVALRQRRELETCEPFCDDADVSSAQHHFIATDVLAITGSAALLSSVVLLVVGYTRNRRTRNFAALRTTQVVGTPDRW